MGQAIHHRFSGQLISHTFHDCKYFATTFFVPVVDRLQAHWEDSHTKLLDRMKQLHNMQQDSIDWLDAKKRVDLHISRASDRLESWLEITYTVDELKKQNAELKVGLELLPLRMPQVSEVEVD